MFKKTIGALTGLISLFVTFFVSKQIALALIVFTPSGADLEERVQFSLLSGITHLVIWVALMWIVAKLVRRILWNQRLSNGA